MTADSDTHLLLALRRGDARAFDALFDQFRPRIFGFLLRFTQRPEVAEELLQETFLRLARKGPDLPESTCLRAWLFTVARNLAVSWLRWSVLDLSRALPARWGGVESDPVTPYHQVQATRAGQALEQALARLPPPLREVFLLVAVEGFEPQEAAEILGIQPDAARQRLHRARTRLRELLPEDLTHEP